MMDKYKVLEPWTSNSLSLSERERDRSGQLQQGDAAEFRRAVFPATVTPPGLVSTQLHYFFLPALMEIWMND